MKEPLWIDEDVVFAVHEALLAQHPGEPGVKDYNILISAIFAPRNHFHYGYTDIFHLAAVYAVRIAKNHGFTDGNKRTATVVASIFLIANGWIITASNEAFEAMILAVAEENSTVGETELAQWFAANTKEMGVAG